MPSAEVTLCDPASFRDPAGFLFRRDGELYRQVNKCYQADFEFLNESGLLRSLYDQGLLVGHVEAAFGLKFIEYVPKSDSQVQRMLSTRKDIFTWYTQEYFRSIWSRSSAAFFRWKTRPSSRAARE